MAKLPWRGVARHIQTDLRHDFKAVLDSVNINCYNQRVMEKTRWTLTELADEAGIPARTIRYYIARGLLEGPDVAGRGASYGTAHRDRLLEIRALQSEGRMLADIARVERVVGHLDMESTTTLALRVLTGDPASVPRA